MKWHESMDQEYMTIINIIAYLRIWSKPSQNWRKKEKESHSIAVQNPALLSVVDKTKGNKWLGKQHGFTITSKQHQHVWYTQLHSTPAKYIHCRLLSIEPKALCTVGYKSSTVLYPQPHTFFLSIYITFCRIDYVQVTTQLITNKINVYWIFILFHYI